MLKKNHFDKRLVKTRGTWGGLVECNRNCTWCAIGVTRPVVRLFTGTLFLLRGRSGVRDPLTQRGGRAAPRPAGTPRVDNIFRVYSRQFSRGGVALIAVVHRGFAPVHRPSSPLLLVSLPRPPPPARPSFLSPSRVLVSAAISPGPGEPLRSAPRDAPRSRL